MFALHCSRGQFNSTSGLCRHVMNCRRQKWTSKVSRTQTVCWGSYKPGQRELWRQSRDNIQLRLHLQWSDRRTTSFLTARLCVGQKVGRRFILRLLFSSWFFFFFTFLIISFLKVFLLTIRIFPKKSFLTIRRKLKKCYT